MNIQLANKVRTEGDINLWAKGLRSLQPRLFKAISIGYYVERAFQASMSGRVAAVFDRSLYLELDGHWCCMATVQLGKGPVNISVNLPPDISALTPGEVVQLDRQGFLIGDKIRVAIAGASIWSPPPSPNWSVETLARGLEALDQSCRGWVPKAGLGCLVWPSSFGNRISHEARAIAPAVAQLREWLYKAVRTEVPVSAPTTTMRLVGMGPGLTPSGDDFLAGMLVALSIIEKLRVVSRLYDEIRPFLTHSTNPVSCLHLAAAAEGAGSEMLHSMLHAVLGGDCASMPERLKEVTRIGQYSGWDGLAGAVTVLRALMAPLRRGTSDVY